MNLRSMTVLLGAAAMLSACEKNAVQQIASAPPGSSVKFFNFAVPTPPATVPAVNFYADATKITATSSTSGVESATGTGSGGVGNAGFYSGITPGPYTITGRISATTDKDVAIATLPVTLADGKYYSFYMSGYYNAAAKSSDAFVVEDAFPAEIDYAQANVRFVGASANANPMTLYATNTVTLIEYPVGGAVSYKSAGAFARLPGGVYNLATRYAGSATNVVVRTAAPFSAGRVYTIAAFGDITVTSTTATNRVRLDLATNR